MHDEFQVPLIPTLECNIKPKVGKPHNLDQSKWKKKKKLQTGLEGYDQ